MHDAALDLIKETDAFLAEHGFGISAAMAQAFVDSPVGMNLVRSFPVGTLDRGQMVMVAAWQAKFAPQIRKRKSKHRRKK